MKQDIIHPQMQGVLIYVTEHQTVNEFSTIINEYIGRWFNASPGPHFSLDFQHLEEIIGTKYAYLVARKCRFKEENGEWIRRSPFGETTIEIDLEKLAPKLRRASRALDPLDLLKPFKVGAL
jgi:hypothetical protein